MKLLIGGAKSKFFHLREFGDALGPYGIDYKLIPDMDMYSHLRNTAYWYPESFLNYLGLAKAPKSFTEVIDEYKPDAILTDTQTYFGYLATKTKIPLLVHLRGDYWKEVQWGYETFYNKSFKKRLGYWWRLKVCGKCFPGAAAILPICKYLADIVRERYPNKPIGVMYQGIRADLWYPSNGMNHLKHPCVGLLQDANVLGKTVEMLTLTKVMKALPDIHFYWVGDGPYRDCVLPELNKFENFKWLGKLSYPEGVRDFLSEIDVYALVSGIDMSPLTVLEAALMEKPIVATNVGGVPELIIDGKTGFLVEKSDAATLTERLMSILSDINLSKQMGSSGRMFIKENFGWDRIAREFASFVKTI